MLLTWVLPAANGGAFQGPTKPETTYSPTYPRVRFWRILLKKSAEGVDGATRADVLGMRFRQWLVARTVSLPVGL